MEEAEKNELIKDLKDGNCDVFIEGPDNVYECTKYDGTKFLKVVDMDDARSGNDYGSCTVEIGDYSVTCDLNSGEWEGDDELLEDEEIMDAIMGLDDVICDELRGTDGCAEAYNKANGTHYPYYWCEFAPVDVTDMDELEDIEVSIPLSFAACPAGEESTKWTEYDYCSDGLELYCIYQYLKANDLLANDENDIELKDEDAKNINIESRGRSLHDMIVEQLEHSHMIDGLQNHPSEIKYHLTIETTIFEEYLGEQ